MLNFLSNEQAAEGVRIAGASRIIGIDLNPNKFDLGKTIYFFDVCFLFTLLENWLALTMLF